MICTMFVCLSPKFGTLHGLLSCRSCSGAESGSSDGEGGRENADIEKGGNEEAPTDDWGVAFRLQGQAL